jgi:hypothetical protein
MPIHVVVHQRRRRHAARVQRGVVRMLGTLLVLGGLALVPVFLVAAFLERWHSTSKSGSVGTGTAILVLALGIAVVILGPFIGVRLIRGKRNLVLFLRRFGYSEATVAITFAVTQTLGPSWRLVTLDDAAIAPVGVSGTVKRAFAAGRVAGGVLGKTWRAIIGLAFWVMSAAMVAVFAVIGFVALHHRSLATLATDTLDSKHATQWDAPGALRVLFAVMASAGAVVVATSLLVFLLIPFLNVQVFLRSTARALRDAEGAQVGAIRSLQSCEQTAQAVRRQTRKIFSPKLVVLRVASDLWQAAVRRLASDAAVVLIDVSEPTENLLWEIEEVTTDPNLHFVLVGSLDRVRSLADMNAPPVPGGLGERLAALLDGREVLAYATDRRGMKRFARALRASLEIAAAAG